jgi:hypothetical protein
MLSAAKHLGTPRDRPFAEFTLSVANVLRVTTRKAPPFVMLSAAKHLHAHPHTPLAAFQRDKKESSQPYDELACQGGVL